MKKTKIIYWASTIILFLFEGVMTALTSHTEFAAEGIRHLGYPAYFGTMLAVFKVIGALILILPMVKIRYKEWAYAGFGITFISAFVSIWCVDGFGLSLLFPMIFFGILALSYTSCHQLHPSNKSI